MTKLNNNTMTGDMLNYCIKNTNLVSFSHESIDNLSISDIKIVIKTNELQTWTFIFTYHLKLVSVRCRVEDQHTQSSLKTVSALMGYAQDRYNEMRCEINGF